LLLWKMETNMGEKGCIGEVEEPRGMVTEGVARARDVIVEWEVMMVVLVEGFEAEEMC